MFVEQVKVEQKLKSRLSALHAEILSQGSDSNMGLVGGKKV
jgi:hypothetical protein